MRRLWVLVLVLGVSALACSSGTNRTLARYYDPQGLFTTSLPAANDVTVTDPQPAQDGPSILSGVVSQPPAPSPSPQSGLGGLGSGLAQTAPADQTIYEAFALTTDTLPDLPAMTLSLLTGDPAIDVKSERAMRLDGMPARLVVADASQNGQVTAGLAVTLSLGTSGTGYVVAAIFPPGAWSSEQPDFLRVVRSFHAGVAPGIRTFPVAGQGS